MGISLFQNMDYEIYLLEQDVQAVDSTPLAHARDISAASAQVEHLVNNLAVGFRIEVYKVEPDGEVRTLVNRYEPPKVKGSHVVQSSGPHVKMGVYEYKGKKYSALGLAQQHHTGEVMVAYVPLYTDDDHVGPPIHLRPVGEFMERFVFQSAYL